MRKTWLMAAVAMGLAALVPAPVLRDGAAQAVPEIYLGREALAKRRFREIERQEQGLREARARLPQCLATACLTPSEAAALAFSQGPERRTAGRFILDVRGGIGPGNPHQLHTENPFYLASDRRVTDFGVLVLAIEPDSLGSLIRTAGGGGDARPTLSGMMKRFAGKRVIVEGEVGLQWIEYRDWESAQRNGNGFHQVWVRVTSPEQITVLGPA